MSPAPNPKDLDPIDYVTAWRRNDPKLEADAKAMWRETGALVPDVNPDARARELAALAYRGDRLVGITSADLQVYPPLRQRFAFVRLLLRPDVSFDAVAVSFVLHVQEALRQWSFANPQESVAGYAALTLPSAPAADPVMPTGLTLVGYTPDGYQVRVFWWDHFRIPVT